MSKGAVAEHTPRIHEFLIGRYGDRQEVVDRKLVAIVQRDDESRFPIFGLIINNSPTGDLDGLDAGKPLTLRFRESDDRGVADKFFEHATGTLEFTANPVDANTVDVLDGTSTIRFEFDDDGSILGTSDVAVPVGATAVDSRNNLLQAINDVVALLVVAEVAVISTNPGILITHVTAGTVGNNALAETGVAITAVGMAGGAEANEVTVRRNAANVTTITVQAGGRAVFIMEAATKEFLRFDTDEDDVQGQLVLSAWSVNLERWQRDASV